MEEKLATVANRNWSYPGARWWKFDFHAHTPASDDYGNGPRHASLQQTTPQEWLLGFMRAGVDCVAVTDHNSGEWIDRLIVALAELEQEQHSEFRPLHLFPGVEVTANGGTHILAVFDPTTGSEGVAMLLGAAGYRGVQGKSEVAAESAPIQVVEAVDKADGISILAHVDEPDGAWSLTGNTLAPLLDSDRLFAMEVKDFASERPELYRKRKLAWAEVLGSDSHHPESESRTRYPGSHYTWVKMANPSLEGLRLALLDGGGFSIRRSDVAEPFNPLAFPKYHIQSVELSQARFMGNGPPTKLAFSPWLNALVGGRGTGKSTVIHGLRLVARRDDELRGLEERSGPRLTFERFNKVPQNRMDEGGLTENTRILWTVMRDGVRHRIHWYWSSSEPVVEVESDEGDWIPSGSQTVTPERFPMRLFSQGQIAEMAGDNQLPLLQVIDEAAGVSNLRVVLDGARNAFYTTRTAIRDLDGRLGRKANLSIDFQDVERKLRLFEETGHTAVLTTYRYRDRQETEVDQQFAAIEELAQLIDNTVEVLEPQDPSDGVFDESLKEDQDVINALAGLRDSVRIAAQDLREASQRLREQARAQREQLTSSTWKRAVEAAGSNYNNLIEELQKDGISDLDEYGSLVQLRQRLEGEMKTIELEEKERGQLVERSNEQLLEVSRARRAMSDARDWFLTTKLAQNNFVRIELCSYSDDPRVIERSLRETLDVLDDRFQDDILQPEGALSGKGIVSSLIADLPDDAVGRLEAFEKRLDDIRARFLSACFGNGNFGGHFNNYLERRFEQDPGFLDRLMTWSPEDGLDVKYSRRGDGKDFQPIAQASAGQRAAAMLAFLLAHGEEPLVLDQPEDDLDNQLIYDLVVRQIRENKVRRQIIVVTHNPNIVVNGDAEMLHALEFGAGQCFVAQSGSLQEKTMREKICQVMEGGREAFERRYRRLGSETGQVR